MKESSALIIQYLDQYARLSERVNKNLRDYLGEPGQGQTHDLRASVRRLDAAIRVLPKSTRKDKGIKRCHERCKDLLRQTSQIRDIDILSGAMAAKSNDPTVILLMNNLREERDEFADNSSKAAWKLFEHPPPKLSKKELPRFVARVETVLKELDSRISGELRISLGEESKIDELHSLRKDCKRLRYTLELFPSATRHEQTIFVLTKWQRVLGGIRDTDVIIDYLSRAKATRGVKALLSSERARRHAKYLAFVRLSRREGRPRALTIARALEVGRPPRSVS